MKITLENVKKHLNEHDTKKLGDFKLDPLMYSIIKTLRDKGYDTTYSCQGHMHFNKYSDDNCLRTYITTYIMINESNHLNVSKLLDFANFEGLHFEFYNSSVVVIRPNPLEASLALECKNSLLGKKSMDSIYKKHYKILKQFENFAIDIVPRKVVKKDKALFDMRKERRKDI